MRFSRRFLLRLLLLLLLGLVFLNNSRNRNRNRGNGMLGVEGSAWVVDERKKGDWFKSLGYYFFVYTVVFGINI